MCEVAVVVSLFRGLESLNVMQELERQRSVNLKQKTKDGNKQ